MSTISSASVPPAPKSKTGPKFGSFLTPIITSTPFSISFWSRILTSFWLSCSIICWSLSQAFCISSADLISVITPPTSVLWTKLGDEIFKTTGQPILEAQFFADSKSVTSVVSGVEKPEIFRTWLASIVLNVWSPLLIEFRIIFLTSSIFEISICFVCPISSFWSLNNFHWYIFAMTEIALSG